MADLKISALTASTTPLAGTEVLPIVQSSTTKKVSIANVTAGRNVAMLKASISDSTTTTSALLLDLQQASLLDNFETAQIKYGLGSSWTAGFAFKANYGTPALSQSRWQVNGTSYVYLDGNGEMTLASGTLVIGTSGKGIDFSATSSGSGTMTSELLADYEEGTWTPAAKANCTVNSVSSAFYTKVGRIVHAYAYFNVTTTSATIEISGLPFNCTGFGPANVFFTTGGTLLPFTGGSYVEPGGAFVTFGVGAVGTSAIMVSVIYFN